MNPRALSDAEIERYARQIIVPGIGAGGQSQLCASRIAVVGAEPGTHIAMLYARALGCTVVPFGAAADVVIAAGLDELDVPAVLAGARCPIVWYALDGARIRAGVSSPPDVLSPRPLTAPSGAIAEVMHAIAACDAVGTAAAVILGWDDCEREYTVALA